MNTELRGEPPRSKAVIEHEIARIESTKAICPACENYAKAQSSKPVAVICCEGACLRGEVARQAANELCYTVLPEKTARVCLGGAFTKNTGQRDLVRNANRVLALEGCFIECASRMMKGVIPDLKAEVIIVDKLYEFDRSLFGVDQMPEAEIKAHARGVAARVAKLI